MKLSLTLLALYLVTSMAIAEEQVAPVTQTEKEKHTAGLFIEPALTYERSDSTVNYPAPFAND